MSIFRAKNIKNNEPSKDSSVSFDEDLLKLVAGGLDDVLPNCQNHEWVFTGSRTDIKTNSTVSYYKCLKCNAEKTERE